MSAPPAGAVSRLNGSIRRPMLLSPQAAGRVSPRQDSASTWSHGLLWASVLFNLLLCFIDTNIVRLGQQEVILGEALILATAVGLPFLSPARRPGRWDVLFAFLLVNWLVLSIIRGTADPKLFRDVAIIPIFIIVGMTCRNSRLHVSIFRLHLVILFFAVWEAIAPTGFVSVFSVGQYFAHTRGQSVDDWWVNNGLYISSIRPEARFLFSNLPLHRLSSVFLEPVSLGNYVVVATVWLIGFWRHMPRWMVIVAAIANILLLIGCDSRLATIACVILLIAAPFKKRLPAVVPLVMAPATIAATFIAVALLNLHAGNDDFPGRVAYSVETLRKFTLDDLGGISLSHMAATQDAGFAYLINSQSLVVAILIWAILFAKPAKTLESRYVHFGMALYLSLNLIVSWSLFSIKTAALLWFLLGQTIAADEVATSRDAALPDKEEEDVSSPPNTVDEARKQLLGQARYRADRTRLR
jgi:putative polymerase